MDSTVAMMALTGLGLLGKLASPRLSILIFHRVHARADRLFPNEPDAARFDRLMRFVARCFHVMTLGEAVNCLEQGELPPRALVITFDDGYADNAEVALPILQRHGLVATFFITTGVLDGGRMWNDSLVECIRHSTKAEIDLGAFDLGRRSLAGLAEKKSVIEALLPRIKYFPLTARDEAINTLKALSGVNALSENLMLSSAQVRQMSRAGMEIGAHTVRHPILSMQALEDAGHEISEGKRHLEQIIDAPVDMFAYPNGKPGRDYAAVHVDLLRQLGFRGAVSTAQGVARVGNDVFQLPRYTPWNNALLSWAMELALNQRNTTFAQVSR